MEANKLILSNVSVEFPFRPYPCQEVYMEKVIRALQQASAAKLCSHFYMNRLVQVILVFLVPWLRAFGIEIYYTFGNFYFQHPQ